MTVTAACPFTGAYRVSSVPVFTATESAVTVMPDPAPTFSVGLVDCLPPPVRPCPGVDGAVRGLPPPPRPERPHSCQWADRGTSTCRSGVHPQVRVIGGRYGGNSHLVDDGAASKGEWDHPSSDRVAVVACVASEAHIGDVGVGCTSSTRTHRLREARRRSRRQHHGSMSG